MMNGMIKERSKNMRILHTADWHLGKIVNEFSMLDLQKEYLEQMLQQVKEHEVDALIMAGDLYDRALPPKEAVALANDVFTELTQTLEVPVFVIAGNHDSNERIEYGSQLFAHTQLFIEGTTKPKIRKVHLEGVNFYLLPYDDHRHIKQVLNKETITHPEDALREQLATIEEDWNADEVNILLFHGFVIHTSAEEVEESDSERPLSIGTVEYIPAEVIEHFDYVALGHLHKAQRVKSEHIRYSGSPVKYSKSEANHRKQNLLIDISKGNLEVTPLAITPSKDLRVIRGRFEDIVKNTSKDYVFFELEDETYVLDAMNKLRQRFPNAMGLEYLNHKIHNTLETHHTKENIQSDNLDDLFGEFYEQNIGMPLNEKQVEAVVETLDRVTTKEENQ